MPRGREREILYPNVSYSLNLSLLRYTLGVYRRYSANQFIVKHSDSSRTLLVILLYIESPPSYAQNLAAGRAQNLKLPVPFAWLLSSGPGVACPPGPWAMTSRQRYSSFNCSARGQTEYNLERNISRSSSKAVHSNNVCWIVSDSRDLQQGHCALRTSCIRELELRRSWQPNRNFVFSLRPSRRDEGHVLSKYSGGKPKRFFSTQLLIL
jgi:hypothetical protein